MIGNTVYVKSGIKFKHDKDDRVAVYKKSKGNGAIDYLYQFIGTLTKSAVFIDSTSSTTFPNLNLIGGRSTLTSAMLADSAQFNYYLLSASDAAVTGGANGIIVNNCMNVKLQNSSVSIVSGMGISVINDIGQNGGAIISGCTAQNTGNEGIVLDGCRSGLITSCNTESCSMYSYAPDYHIANDSPGINTIKANPSSYGPSLPYGPFGNSIVGSHSRNGMSSVVVLAGLGMSDYNNPSGQLFIEGNHVYRDASFNWPTGSAAIQAVGPKAVISDNNINGFESGIILQRNNTRAEASVIKGNVIHGTKVLNSKGINILNAAFTVIQDNSIINNETAISIAAQDGYRIIGNYISDFLYVLDDQVGTAPESIYANNVILFNKQNATCQGQTTETLKCDCTINNFEFKTSTKTPDQNIGNVRTCVAY